MPKPTSQFLQYFGLDLGSNTFSATIIENQRDRLKVVRDASYVVRLSEGLKSTGLIKNQAMDRALETLKKIAADYDLENLARKRAVATQVLRVATNSLDFTTRAEELIGIPIETISPKQEAMITARGAVVGLELQDNLLMVDVGGQSTELAIRQDGQWTSQSIPLGVVRLYEMHPDAPSAWRSEIQAVLRQQLPQNYHGDMIAVAGSATTLAMLVARSSTWNRDRVHGTQIRQTVLGLWLDKMLHLRPEQRTAQYNIEPGRADVFPAGLVYLDEIMRHTGVSSFIVSANGLRTGAAISLMEDKQWTWH